MFLEIQYVLTSSVTGIKVLCRCALKRRARNDWPPYSSSIDVDAVTTIEVDG